MLYRPSQVEPQFTTVTIDDKQVNLIYVDIEGEDYEKCVASASNMWCSSKPGEWGRGLVNSRNDPHKVERIGRLGEMAFAKLKGLEVDLAYRKGGMDEDFILNGKLVDVKTASEFKYNVGLVRVTKTLACDLYVFAFVGWEQEGRARVYVVGFATKEDIVRRPQVAAKRGSHRNWEVPYLELKSVELL